MATASRSWLPGLGYYCEKGHRFNLRQFWADHKAVLPIHYAVYLADVGCKKSAAANVESVFSGAGKFTAEAPSTGAELLTRMVKLHYNWKYLFLRPTMAQIIDRYNIKFRTVPADATAPTAAPTAAPAVAAPVAA